MRIGCGVGLSDGGAAAWTPAALGPFAWYRGDRLVTQVAGPKASAWGDGAALGGAQDASQGTDANRPGYTAADANYGGQSSLTLAAALQLATATAADWTFLHNGTGMSVWFVARSTDAAQTGYLLTTNSSGSGAALGIGVVALATSMRLQVGNGATAAIQLDTGGGTFTANATHDLGFSYRTGTDPDALCYLNGAAGATANETNAPSASAPNTALRINGTGTPANGFIGSLAELVICNRVLTPAEFALLRAYRLARYGA